MPATGKNIRLFLVDGLPSGLITAEIGNWTGKVLSFPRGLLPQALKRDEIAKTGIYFLVGLDPEQSGRSLVYIGESDDVSRRLKQHDTDNKMDFFVQVALIVSKDENLTKAHVRYLEYHLIELTKTIGTARLFNGTQGSQVSLPEADRNDMEYVLDQLKVLLPVLGFTFLQEPPKRHSLTGVHMADTLQESGPIFELDLHNGQIHAEAFESNGQFIVMAGAHCRHPNQFSPSFSEKQFGYIISDIKASIQEGILQERPESLVLTRDKSFKSPSTAAMFVCGSSKNGRIYWKVKGTNQTYADWRQAQLDQIQPANLSGEKVLV